MNLDRLEAVAKDAAQTVNPSRHGDEIKWSVNGVIYEEHPGREWMRRFHQDFDPPTVLALIDRLRKAERVVEAVQVGRCPNCGVWHREEPQMREALDAYDREETDGVGPR